MNTRREGAAASARREARKIRVAHRNVPILLEVAGAMVDGDRLVDACCCALFLFSDDMGYAIAAENDRWAGLKVFGLDEDEALVMLQDQWRLADGLTLGDALRALAAGAAVEEITNPQGGDNGR